MRNVSDVDSMRPNHWRSRLPKGESYPVKLGEVLDSLTTSGGHVREIAFALRVLVRGPHRPYSLLDGGGWPLVTAELQPEGGSSVNAGTIDVRIHSVPSHERALVRKLLIDHGLLVRLAEWVRDAERAPVTWRAVPRRCTISLAPDATALPICDRPRGPGTSDIEPDDWPPA